MIDVVQEVLGEGFVPFSKPLRVDVECFVTQPKKTKLEAPRADIDNYLKAIFDCLNTKMWDDDNQIISVYATKQWAPKGEQGYFNVGVDEL